MTDLLSRLKGWFEPKPDPDAAAFLLNAQGPRSIHGPAPTAADMDELLAYLPRLYPGGIAIKTCSVAQGSQWPRYVEVVNDFYAGVANDCWRDVDYQAHGARIMLESSAYIAQATVADIQSMLTYCSRGERFCDGHHGAMIERGYVLKVLNRLAVLREGM